MKREHFILGRELHELADEKDRQRVVRQRAGIEYALSKRGMLVVT